MAVEERRHPEAERLAEYADGVLDAESRAEVDQHLADCADCRAVVMETMAFLDGKPCDPGERNAQGRSLSPAALGPGSNGRACCRGGAWFSRSASRGRSGSAACSDRAPTVPNCRN